MDKTTLTSYQLVELVASLDDHLRPAQRDHPINQRHNQYHLFYMHKERLVSRQNNFQSNQLFHCSTVETAANALRLSCHQPFDHRKRLPLRVPSLPHRLTAHNQCDHTDYGLLLHSHDEQIFA